MNPANLPETTDPLAAVFLAALSQYDVAQANGLPRDHSQSVVVADLLRKCSALSEIPATDSLPTRLRTPLTPDVGEVRQVGRFPVTGILGRGGMGVVYLATDPDLGRPLAVKLLRGEDGEGVERFRLEANALAGLTHPNIVRVYEFGEDIGRPYLALEYVEGRTLRDALRTGPLSAAAAARMMQPIAQAVQAAHDAGVIHRDLKPANILLTKDQTPKVTDFGLAKRLDSAEGLTATGVLLGTPQYMAPEQAFGLETERRTDVYGLGATLYECLTGRPPFMGATALDILRQVADDDPVPVRRLNSAVPRDLETICHKCLAKQPGQRYASAAALADDLGRFLAGHAVHARPLGVVERLWRWGRRHRLAATLIVVTVASVLTGTSVALWQAQEARSARDAALNAQAAALTDQRAAEEQADQASAVNAFLINDLLRQASSTVQADDQAKPDPQLTVRAALDRAAAKVGPRFAERPHLEAHLRMTLGNAYREVGETEKALAQLRPAYAFIHAQLGRTHPTALNALNDLALTEADAGQLASAIARFEECLQLKRTTLGATHLSTLATAQNLALTYQLNQQFVQALLLHEQVAQHYEKLLGPTNPLTLEAQHNLATAYGHVGRIPEALQLFTAVWQQQERTLGPEHPTTINTLGNLAQVHLTAAELSMALERFEKAVRLHCQVLGPHHPNTLQLLQRQAQAYAEAEQLPRALVLAEESLRLHRTHLGAQHPATLTQMLRLALMYGPAGRVDEAIALLDDCRRGQQAKLGADHPDTLTTLHALGLARWNGQQRAQAVELLEECHRRRHARWGAQHLATAEAAFSLAVVYWHSQRRAESIRLYAAAYETRSALAPHTPQTAMNQRDLGVGLFQLGRFAEAEPHLLGWHAHISQAIGAPSALVQDARRRVANLYEQWGKPTEAERWRQPPAERLPLPRLEPPLAP
jgi:tetratricopeptide (TPR) repeat protein